MDSNPTPDTNCYEGRWARIPRPEHQMLRIRAHPACDQPLYSNGDRVAHRTDNPVAALLELTPETGRGQGFNPAPFRPRTIRAG